MQSPLHQALEHYGLEERAFERLEGGNANTSYRLGNELVLTFFQEKELEQVRALAALLLHLEAHDIPTNRVKRSLDGQTVVLVEGEPVMLKTWLVGELDPTPSSQRLQRAGAAMARLHQVPPPSKLPAFDLYGLPMAEEVSKAGIDPDFEDWVSTRLPELLARFPTLPTGLIHGDLFWDNLVYTSQGPAWLDFEECHVAPRVYDLGMAFVGMCVRGGRPHIPSIHAFLQGYERVSPLISPEREALTPAAELSALACASWRFWRYHLDRPQPHKQHLHREMQAVAGHLAALAPDVLDTGRER